MLPQRPGEITTVDWTSEQLAILVDAADSRDPEVVMQVLLGVRCVCTPAYVSIILIRTKIVSILCKAMEGHLFADNFPLLMAAELLLSGADFRVLAIIDRSGWCVLPMSCRRHVCKMLACSKLLPSQVHFAQLAYNGRGGGFRAPANVKRVAGRWLGCLVLLHSVRQFDAH